MKLYVDPRLTKNESDRMASIGEAYAAAKEAFKNGERWVEIYLCSGVHRIEREILIDGKDMPRHAALSFIGRKDAFLTSNVDIDGSLFKKVDGKPYYAYTLPESARLSDGSFPAFRDLYVDGVPFRLARSGKDYTTPVDSCRLAKNSGLNSDDRLLYVSRSALGDIELTENGDVIGDLEFWIKTEWQVHCIHIENVGDTPSKFVDDAGETLYPARVREKDWKNFIGAYYSRLTDFPYWFANNKALIENPGDFFYHRDAGTIYVYPYGNLEGATVSYPLAERIFHLENAENITFRDLNIYGLTVNYITEYGYITGQGGYIKIKDPKTGAQFGFLPYGAIYGENVERIRIEGCSIENVGDDGVNFRGAVSNVTVTGNRFVNMGGSAVRFGMNTGEYSFRIYNRDIEITNNYIENTGRVFSSNTAILIASVLRLNLSYNTILKSSYSAISIGWSWGSMWGKTSAIFDREDCVNVKYANVSHNYIEDFMVGMKDGGAIYVLGGNATDKFGTYLNTMNNNYVVLKENVARGTIQWTVFYHDSGASHWDDYDNVLMVEKGMRPPHYTYVSYQIHWAASCNRTRDLYIVGYPAQDHFDEDDYPKGYNDKTNKTLTGVYVSLGRCTPQEFKDTYEYRVDPVDGSYECWNEHFKKYDDRVERIHLYGNLGEDDRIPVEKLKRICDASGCDTCHPILKQP